MTATRTPKRKGKDKTKMKIKLKLKSKIKEFFKKRKGVGEKRKIQEKKPNFNDL